jgi:hypothetical protein
MDVEMDAVRASTLTAREDCESTSRAAIMWKAGDRVRVCHFTNPERTDGHKINMANGSLGWFVDRNDLVAVQM